MQITFVLNKLAVFLLYPPFCKMDEQPDSRSLREYHFKRIKWGKGDIKNEREEKSKTSADKEYEGYDEQN